MQQKSDLDSTSESAGAKPIETVSLSADRADASPPRRRCPSRWRSTLVLAFADLDAIWRSWLCRGFLLVSALVTVLELKGMQANHQVASQMLEAIYVTYIVVWMHGVIFIAGAALAREQDCLGDAILSRGVTRGEYISAKLFARWLATLLMIGVVLFRQAFGLFAKIN